jgi:hypothetical protein
MSSSEGLEILKNWQTKESTVLLSGVAQLERLYDVPVRVSAVTPSPIVLSRIASDESVTVELAGAEFSILSGVPTSVLIVSLDIKLPDGKSVVLSERRSSAESIPTSGS